MCSHPTSRLAWSVLSAPDKSIRGLSQSGRVNVGQALVTIMKTAQLAQTTQGQMFLQMQRVA